MVKKKRKKKKPTDTYQSIFTEKDKGNFTTVKTSLKSILKDYDTNYPIINQLVLDANDIVIRTYQFIRLYTLYKYNQFKNGVITNNILLPTMDKDNILYFIRAGGIRDKRGKKATNKAFEKELNDFYENEFKTCCPKEKFSLINKTYLTPYLAQQIQTGFNNNIKEHFLTRIRRFMNIEVAKWDILIDDKKEFNKIKNAILSNKLNIDNLGEELYIKYKDFGIHIQTNYLPQEFEKVYGYDVKVHPEKYVFYTIKMNETIEQYNSELKEDERKKLFQPIPLRNSIVPSYITIDTNVILSLFKGNGESNKNKKTKKYKNYIWDKIFKTNVSVMNKKHNEFKTIQTDGIGVSICFQKKGKRYKENSNTESENDINLYINELDKSDLDICKTKKLIGIDPGKLSLVYMTDKENNKLRYTSCQRRKESLRKRCSRITLAERKKHGIIPLETELSKYNCKSVNYEKFKQYITAKTKLNDKVKDFYQQKLFRKLKWRTTIYRRKSEDKFLNNIAKTFGKADDILLCYGDWSNNKQMKYIMPTKGVGLRRIINKRYNGVLVNEFKTSKLCSKCHHELENYKSNKTQSVQYIHRLLVCNGCQNQRFCKNNGSESKKVVFMNRDINACTNIRNIATKWISSQIRPEPFCQRFAS